MSTTRRRRRRVVALSSQDEARVERGELPEAEAEAQRRRQLDALTDRRSRDGGVLQEDHEGSETSNDARLLGEVPPHWA